MEVHMPNTKWDQTIPKPGIWEQRKVYCRAKQEDKWFVAPKTKLPQGFHQSVFKG